MKIDIGIVFAALTIALIFLGMAGTLFWYVMRLSLRPLEVTNKAMLGDMGEFKKSLNKLFGKVKSEDELNRMMEIKIDDHEKEQHHYRLTETGTFRIQQPGQQPQ